MLPVLILAGGLATRMRPITKAIPKALIAVAGRPFVCHQLDYLFNQGVRDVVISVGYLGEMIESELGDGSDFGLKIQYSYDGPKLLGTAGAIKKALHLIGDNFFVLYGDSFLPINFQEVQNRFEKLQRPALMTVLKNKNQWDVSNVFYENGILIEYNKAKQNDNMHHIDYGLAIVNRSIFSSCPEDNFCDLSDLYHQLSLKGDLGGYEVNKRFYEIGSMNGLKEAEEYFIKIDRESL